jgi:ABC-2 type transport system ATP-binding protein
VILSTHIVEDIGQTCSEMAVLSKGRILFRGSPADLIREAEGKVWTVIRAEPIVSEEGLRVVSMVHLAQGIQSRLVGDPSGRYPQAVPVQPGLEDGYVRLMQQAGEAVSGES